MTESEEYTYPTESTQLALDAVSRLVDDLRGRRGLGHEWGQIDEDIRMEIVVEWQGFIQHAMEQYLDVYRDDHRYDHAGEDT